MTPPRCDRGWEADAHREGRLGAKDVESFERHCRTCAVCTQGLIRDERLRALVRRLPVAEPGELPLKRLRARIIRDVTTDAPSLSSLSSWRRLALLSALGVALVTLAGLSGMRMASKTRAATAGSALFARPVAPLAAAVTPGAGAVWTQAREGGMEQVDLKAGTLRLHVRPQAPGERFVVRLPDGEIEVRGTTFDVTVLDRSTRRISVDEGTVVLRVQGSPDRSLGPGAEWTAAESPPSRSNEAPAVGATSAPATMPRGRPGGAHDGEVLAADEGASVYVDAIRSFREGQYGSAATAFHAFALAHPLATEAEDASFLEALSLAREGRADAAALAAERHLEKFPRSFRRKEASILVARAASHRGRCDEALGIVAPWIGASPDAEIESVLVACGDSGAASR